MKVLSILFGIAVAMAACSPGKRRTRRAVSLLSLPPPLPVSSGFFVS